MNLRRTLSSVMAAGVAFASVASLAACVPSPTKAVSSDPVPAVTSSQEERIRKQAIDAIISADKTYDSQSLKSRMTGPALEVRSSQLKIAKATKKADQSMEIPDKLSQSIVTTSAAWPRDLFAITTVTDDQQSQRLLVLNQENATSNYKVWGLVRLFSGVQMPKFTVADTGSEQGDANTSGLVATPSEVAQHYADVLTNGSTSKYANDFEKDAFRDSLKELTQSVDQAIKRNKGSQKETYTADDKDIKVLRTADGGALAVVKFTSVWIRTAGGDRKSLPASDQEKALFGKSKTSNTLEVTYVNEVAFYIPASGSKQQIRAVGAERQPVAVEAKTTKDKKNK